MRIIIRSTVKFTKENKDKTMGKKEIIEMINRETNAWNNQNAEELTALFHPDMVWPWPRNSNDHDPMKWIITQGRFNEDRWKKNWHLRLSILIRFGNTRKTAKQIIGRVEHAKSILKLMMDGN
jgi:predicted RNA polymerase sigma factor